MSIKIYLPTQYFYFKKAINLYGQVKISKDDVIVYYIVESTFDFKPSANVMDIEPRHLRFLGCICSFKSCDEQNQCKKFNMRLCFTFDENKENISLTYVGIIPETLKHAKIILYENNIRKLFVTGKNVDHKCEECDYFELSRLVDLTLKSQKHENNAKKIILNIGHFLTGSPFVFFQYLFENILVNKLIEHTTVYKNFKEWKQTYGKGSRQPNIILDRVIGMLLMVVLFSLAIQPGDFLIKVSHAIIGNVYSLLNVLEGSPIGLKLNIHLNNFFLDCFKYHIALWSTFLDFIEPFERQVYFVIAFFGFLGFTFQIALLADLVSVIGLHSHCFYIYTKVLYNVENKGLSVLWQVVRGNRYNVLKGRIESHNYMNRQLYLATIFFSAILFLYPTTFVYYIVFGTLKVLTSGMLTLFDNFRRNFMCLPIESIMIWFVKGFCKLDCLKIKSNFPVDKEFFIDEHHKVDVSVFKIET
ncbi:phosphatidylinositol N-acetylglucosaminyltransferase subunit Q [Drosophila bipectinata]|uniref:phosphatidylinositol N-acetylglucosaminyltransferase subunit Q n=1 Tax=Drosophila bipectinata TaxID=42026 RepID=UPI001C8ADD2D|nr:phosphatidylinositol N-acetylglucosaminyltransferase subunit Q [Drosophila bipectinata]